MSKRHAFADNRIFEDNLKELYRIHIMWRHMSVDHPTHRDRLLENQKKINLFDSFEIRVLPHQILRNVKNTIMAYHIKDDPGNISTSMAQNIPRISDSWPHDSNNHAFCNI